MIGREDLEDLLITVKESVNITDLRYLILEDFEDFEGLKFTLLKLFVSDDYSCDLDFETYNYDLKTIYDFDKLKEETIKELKSYSNRFKFNYSTRSIYKSSRQNNLQEFDELEIRISDLFPSDYEVDRILNLVGKGVRGGKLKCEPITERYIEDGKETLFIYTPKNVELVLNDITTIKSDSGRQHRTTIRSIFVVDKKKVAKPYYNLEYEVTGYSDGTEIYIRQA